MQKKHLEMGMAVLMVISSFYLGRLGAQMRTMHREIAEAVSSNEAVHKVVIDAGHGGFDSGKVGIHGELEKDINLSIAQKVQKQMEHLGIQTVMTRETDRGLYEETEENKKQQDMKQRCIRINESGADMAVSIHQNSYTEETVCGPQVFYYETSAEGQRAAQLLQDALNERLQIPRPRTIKANDTYYILKKTEIPTVIAECGFLSNEEEARHLAEEAYQEQVALAISEGIMNYLLQ